MPRKKKRIVELTDETEVAAHRVPRIREKKLGREYGLHWIGTSDIDIDPRQDAKEYLDTLVHELMHLYFVDLNEETVRIITANIVEAIWAKNYRRLQK